MVELYIDGKKADLTTTVTVPMNYELEKLENPTIIKNNFSKTISLEATPNNNQIFSYYYDLTKIHTGVGFCANTRVPFELYRDCNLIETGYLQLNNIKYKGNIYTYEITLYGGLGDFLYCLAYDEDGNEKTLADLNYGIGKNDANFNFKINADNVVRAWNTIDAEDSSTSLGSTINFIPSYNGLYDDFDNNRVLIHNADNIFPSTLADDNGDETYGTFEGYGMAELNEEMTEWEMRDLRCYKQRPALRLEKFINAICNKNNNGGYEVELDEKYFFNRDNPYYTNTWIALPLLNPDSTEWPQNSNNLDFTTNSKLSVSLNSEDGLTSELKYSAYSADELINEFGGSSTIEVDVDFSLKVSSDYYNGNPKLLFSKTYKEKKKTKQLWTGLGVWIEAEVNGTIVGISDCLVLTSSLQNKLPDITDFKANWKNTPKTKYLMVDGYFKWGDANYNYIFNDVNGNNSFRVTLKNIPNLSGIKYTLKTKRWYSENPYGMNKWETPYLFTPDGSYLQMKSGELIDIECDGSISINSMEKSLQNYTVTKQQLLKNKITPASLLLSYTKLFGLYFVKDAQRKKVKILTKNTFFEDNEVIDIDNKIDYSNEVKIEPLMFNKKWYTLKCPALDTTQMKTYKADYYEAEYGQKRINTNYNFNNDEQDIYSSNQYQNVITMLDSSKYYRNFVNDNSVNLPTFSVDGCKYKLWQDYNVSETREVDLRPKDIMRDMTTPAQFGTLVGADVFPKICCFDMDKDKKSLNDLSVSLVFFNGIKYLKDSKEQSVYYTVSDDLPIMSTLNEGKPMYLFSNYEYNEEGEKFCNRVNYLPQFTRYDIVNGRVINSLDFGLPYETYINDEYTEDSTLYNQYWRGLYTDQFSENTRKVTAYVKFDDIQLGNHSLSNFYYFNNCYWLLNKIIDYDLANPQKKVKCEFIKVNDINSYTNGQKLRIPYFEVQLEQDNNVTFQLLEGDYNVQYGEPLKIGVMCDSTIDYIQVNMGGKNITNDVWDGMSELIYIPKVTGDVSIYARAFEPITIPIAYNTTATIPSVAANKTLKIAMGTENNVIWSTNLGGDTGVTDVTLLEYKPTLYVKLTPNTPKTLLNTTYVIGFTDGTTYSYSSSSSGENQTTINLPENKLINSIIVDIKGCRIAK